MRRSFLCIAALWALVSGVACPSGDAEDESPFGRAAATAAALSAEEIRQRVSDAKERMVTGKLEEAIELLQPVVSREVVDPEVLELYGLALLRSNRPSLAVWPLARAAAGAAPESDAAWLHAQALFGGGDPQAAIAELTRLIDLLPEDPRLRRLRAKAYQRALALELALEDLDVLIELVPEEVSAIEGRLQLLIELEHFQEAREAIAELGRRLEEVGAPDEAKGRLCASAGLFEQERGEPARAREMLAECLAKYPIEPDVVLPWVIFLDRVGESEEATAALEQTVTGLGAAKLRLHLALADRYAAAGRKEDTATSLRAASRLLKTPQPLFALADHHVKWGDLEAAREAVHGAIEMQVGSRPGEPGFDWSTLPVTGRFAFGDILIQAEQLGEVESLIESLEADEAEPVYALLLRARQALEQGEPALALERFEEAFKYWPSNVAARYLAGRASMELGEFDRGMSLYQDAFRADPTGSDAGLVLARMQAAQGLPGAATTTLSTLLGLKNDDPVVVRLFGNLAQAIGAFEASEETRRDLEVRLGWADEAHADRAVELMLRQGRDAAIAHLESVAGFPDPDHLESLLLWFRLQSERGAEARGAASARIDSLRSASSDRASVQLLWARVLRTLGERSEEALAAARRAIELDPALVEGHIELGRLLLEFGEAEQAAEAFARAREIDPGNLQGAMGEADAVMATGRREEAEALYRKALVTHPWHGRAARALARIAMDREDHGEQTLVWALWSSRFAEGETSTAATLLAELRLARNEPQDAVSALQLALETTTVPDPRLLYLLGRALAELGETQRAREALEDALTVGDFPEREAARALIVSIGAGVSE